ncbi:MAG: putative transporter, partial [Frankiales bacterium]|nr:putative transporter [Frankiales bacterium]
MAIYVLVFLGGTPVGAPLIGVLAEALGPRSSLLIGGVVCSVSAVAAASFLSRVSTSDLLRGTEAAAPEPSAGLAHGPVLAGEATERAGSGR